ncbi:MAG: SDR family oxidoreductase, partial [Gammaproteobacteria bacterium]|nr:SDR family oxidoreductase [Gammaproteobacteria bacterium]
MTDALRLFGLKAIVTEAGSGIGEAIVRTFVKQGAEVLAIDAAGSGVETHFRKVSGVSGVVLDMHALDASKQLASEAKKSLGGLDIVVSNFDWHRKTPINDTDAGAAEELTENMLARTAAIYDATLSLLQRSPAGRMIVIGCLRSVFGKDGTMAYRNTELAMHRLVSKLAARGGEFGVTANYIQPGAVMTPASRPVFAADRELRDYCIRQSSAKRLADPVDIAK